MDPNQRYTEIKNNEEQDDDLSLHGGEIENGKQEKTYLCRKEIKEQ